MSKPTKVPIWNTGLTDNVEPSAGEKIQGWVNGGQVPAGTLNWLMELHGEWLTWLNVFESTAHTWSALQTFSASVLLTEAVPAPTTAFSGYNVTPANTPICGGFILTGGGGPTIRDGYNIASVAYSGSTLQITLNKPINWTSASNYKAYIAGMAGSTGEILTGFFTSATVLQLTVRNAVAGTTTDLSATAVNVNFVVFGRP